MAAMLAVLGGCADAGRARPDRCRAVGGRAAAAGRATAPASTGGRDCAAPARARRQPPRVPPHQAQFERALQAQRAGRSDEAERAMRALAQAHPGTRRRARQPGPDPCAAPAAPTEAVAALERAVQASPTQPRFFNELGIAYRSNGQFDKAREAYEPALALDAEPRRSPAQPRHPARPLPRQRRHGARDLRALPRAHTGRRRRGDEVGGRPAPTQAGTGRAAHSPSTQVAKGGKEQP